MALNCCLRRKLEINNLDMPFLVLSRMNYLMFIAKIKLTNKFGMQGIKKYILEDVGTKKCAIRNFRNFQMTKD